MTILARLLLLVALAAGLAAGPAAAETAPKPPKGMTQAEFDQLVTAISREVIKQLRDPAAKTELKPGETPGAEAKRAFEARVVFRRFGEVLGAYPAYMAQIGRLQSELNAPDGLSALLYLFLLVLAIAAALIVERVVRAGLGRARRFVTRGAAPPFGLPRLAALFAVDAVPVAALWLVAETAEGLLAGSETQARMSSLVLGALVAWRFYMLIYRAWLQPDFAAARIVPLDDAGARTVYRCLGVFVLILLAARSWLRLHIAAGTAPDLIGAAMLVNTAIGTACFVFIIWRARAPVAAWLGALAGTTTGVHAWKGAAAQHWWIAGIAFYLASAAAQALGALSGRLDVAAGLNKTQSILVGLLLIETLMWYLARRDAAAGTVAAGPREPRIVDVAVRCLRVAVRVAVMVELAQIWVVEVLGLVAAAEWRSLGRMLATAGATVFLAYVLWQVVKFQIDRYMARNPIAVAGPGAGEGDSHAVPQSASRLRTLMPLFRFTIAALIFVLAILIVLSELGVNTAPLIAGASIFGLALSFGSQSLVRDVVSGVFYLVDDAFRVGEYVDTGKAKGTVEGFTLRSLQLRHQNGQVHTIPFGQLGAITNFSRDWIIMKFNLRLSIGTDIELVRKITKKIGQEMMEDAELKKDMIEPLKLQGIADIADNSLVVRFKLTAKPGNPTFVQRQAIKRIYQVFREKGIEFAQATVSVQTLGDSSGGLAAGAAASTLQPARAG